MFLAFWALVLVRQIPGFSWQAEARWPEAVVLVLAAWVTVAGLARRISLQSALMAAGVIGGLGGAAHWASYVTRVPFGPLQIPCAEGPSPFQGWFVFSGLIWAVLLLNARGLARLILEPVAGHPHHGLRLLVLSAFLMLVLVLAMEPFGSTAHHYWLWGETHLPLSWQGVPLSCVLAWAGVSVIASLAATPFLINKHPRPAPAAREPAWIWTLLSVLFAVGNAVHGLWPAAGVAMGSGVAAAAFGMSWWRRTV